MDKQTGHSEDTAAPAVARNTAQAVPSSSDLGDMPMMPVPKAATGVRGDVTPPGAFGVGMKGSVTRRENGRWEYRFDVGLTPVRLSLLYAHVLTKGRVRRVRDWIGSQPIVDYLGDSAGRPPRTTNIAVVLAASRSADAWEAA